MAETSLAAQTEGAVEFSLWGRVLGKHTEKTALFKVEGGLVTLKFHSLLRGSTASEECPSPNLGLVSLKYGWLA